ncbi:MAG TPA: glyceraldehyde 3-phosphate dehydrogenase NAD-binding domain-containing protein, partial [Chitinophagaceae bacterium]|nr:glyceraldehyde 3-phosphate dehydrogenase NAD-binding domain-containing protein [Chitinophagaceae bacterium]
GRACLKIIADTKDLELVAINDLMPIENAAYLLGHDSIYGRYQGNVKVEGNKLYVNDKELLFFNEADPSKLPWKALAIDIVIESTGRFTKREDAANHIAAGAKRVIISGPTKSLHTPTVVYGVNSSDATTDVFSIGSCTTNNIGPIIEILGRRLGIQKAILNTIHAYTASQTAVDAPSKRDFRMGRSAAINLTPATTGAAIAITKALPNYQGKFDGIAIRTPVAIGSISDITFIASRATSPEEVNQLLKEEALTERYREVVLASDEPLVSTDIIKSPFATIIDLQMTRVVGGDLVKVMAWYDNEWGFSNQMKRQILAL